MHKSRESEPKSKKDIARRTARKIGITGISGLAALTGGAAAANAQPTAPIRALIDERAPGSLVATDYIPIASDRELRDKLPPAQYRLNRQLQSFAVAISKKNLNYQGPIKSFKNKDEYNQWSVEYFTKNIGDPTYTITTSANSKPNGNPDMRDIHSVTLVSPDVTLELFKGFSDGQWSISNRYQMPNSTKSVSTTASVSTGLTPNKAVAAERQMVQFLADAQHGIEPHYFEPIRIPSQTQ